MTSKSNILSIGSDFKELSDKPPKTNNPKAYFEFNFEKHMQRLLLEGNKPQNLDASSMERFAATEIMRNGKQYYEFGPDNFKSGTIISGISFNPKGMLLRVKNRIDKEHWIKENVIQYRKNSMVHIQQIVSDALKEEEMEIYQYLCYLNKSLNKK
ncbi:uncharacterized protein LOC108113277 [Drosophila eugracilis]|uniref:uncharacterized protein LOC108113277 n=1 Tax=Drosophila eugracilis TaxID=29029 RepID=UPI0007E68B69|nr:uncharacterized protein LOC108113277 [Drosophila eugracilis]